MWANHFGRKLLSSRQPMVSGQSSAWIEMICLYTEGELIAFLCHSSTSSAQWIGGQMVFPLHFWWVHQFDPKATVGWINPPSAAKGSCPFKDGRQLKRDVVAIPIISAVAMFICSWRFGRLNTSHKPFLQSSSSQCSLPSLGKVTIIHPRSSKASKVSENVVILGCCSYPSPPPKKPGSYLVIDAPAVPQPAARRCWRPLTMPSRFPQAAPEGYTIGCRWGISAPNFEPFCVSWIWINVNPWLINPWLFNWKGAI